MSDHPQIDVLWYTKKDGTKVHSSAAGAYQVMGYTWKDQNMRKRRAKYNIKDYSAESQDRFCVILFKYKRPGMLDLIIQGKIKEATDKYGSYEWASLPPGRYGQLIKTMEEALKLYKDYLKKECAGESDLHLKKGFLKELEVTCQCGCSSKENNSAKSEDSIIRVVRKWEYNSGVNSTSSTTGTFSIDNDDLTGYILEPIGESTTESGKDKRIPPGTYNLMWHTSGRYPKDKYSSKGKEDYLNNGFPKLYNDSVSAGRGILIHIGNKG